MRAKKQGGRGKKRTAIIRKKIVLIREDFACAVPGDSLRCCLVIAIARSTKLGRVSVARTYYRHLATRAKYAMLESAQLLERLDRESAGCRAGMEFEIELPEDFA